MANAKVIIAQLLDQQEANMKLLNLENKELKEELLKVEVSWERTLTSPCSVSRCWSESCMRRGTR
jgi:hypothetical protein